MDPVPVLFGISVFAIRHRKSPGMFLRAKA